MFREALITYPWVQWNIIDELRFFGDPHAQQEKDPEAPILDAPRVGSKYSMWKIPKDLKLVLKTAVILGKNHGDIGVYVSTFT